MSITKEEAQMDRAFDDCYRLFKGYIIESLDFGYTDKEIIEVLGGDRISRAVVEKVKEERK